MSNITPSYYKGFALRYEDRVVTLKDYFTYRCGFLLGNVGKYLVRYEEKNGAEDLGKALNYMDNLKEDFIWEAKFNEPAHLSPMLDEMEYRLASHNKFMKPFINLVNFYKIGARHNFSVTLYELISEVEKEQFYLANKDRFPHGWDLIAECGKDLDENCNFISRKSLLNARLNELSNKFYSDPTSVSKQDREDAANLCLYVWQLCLDEYFYIFNVNRDLPEFTYILDSSLSFEEKIKKYDNQYKLAEIISHYFEHRNSKFENFMREALTKYSPEFFCLLGEELGIIKVDK